MKTALLEILEKYHPDRIIIESSGSAFPATLAFQIRELERETSRALTLDAIVTVIDAENFSGYEDTSITARMQAQYTDVLLINKWEHISERALDDVLEHLNTLNELTPKIRCSGKSVDPALIFSIDSKLFRDPLLLPPIEAKGDVTASQQHHDEVETITVLRGAPVPTNAHAHAGHAHVHTTAAPSDAHPHPAAHPPPPLLDEPTLTAALHQLPKEYVYRVKGFIRFAPPSKSTSATADSESLKQQQKQQWWILNWAFGRWELVDTPAPAPPSNAAAAEDEEDDEHGVVRLTVMGERGEVQRFAKRLAEALGAAVVA
jgi:G3E family GTPase